MMNNIVFDFPAFCFQPSQYNGLSSSCSEKMLWENSKRRKKKAVINEQGKFTAFMREKHGFSFI
jgi:hypothetical protein